MSKLETKGWGPWRSDWYSLCSAHQQLNNNCYLCSAGYWQNRYMQKFSGAVYIICPKLWIWWANLKLRL